MWKTALLEKNYILLEPDVSYAYNIHLQKQL